MLSFSLWEDFLASEILCSIEKRLFPLHVVDTVDKIRAETISKGSRAEVRRKEKMSKWRKHNKRREVKETVDGCCLSHLQQMTEDTVGADRFITPDSWTSGTFFFGDEVNHTAIFSPTLLVFACLALASPANSLVFFCWVPCLPICCLSGLLSWGVFFLISSSLL